MNARPKAPWILVGVLLGYGVLNATQLWNIDHRIAAEGQDRWSSVNVQPTRDVELMDGVWSSSVMRERRGLYLALAAVAPGASVTIPPPDGPGDSSVQPDQLYGLGRASSVRVAEYDSLALGEKLPADLPVIARDRGGDTRGPGPFRIITGATAGEPLPPHDRDAGRELWQPVGGPRSPNLILVQDSEGIALVEASLVSGHVELP